MPSSRQSDNAWTIRDADSRNGTFVNGQKIDDAVLAAGQPDPAWLDRVLLRQSETPPQFHQAGITVTQTLIKNQAIDQGRRRRLSAGWRPFPIRNKRQELLLLYQLSIKLLGCDEPDEVVRVALELLADWTHATLAGFLWISDDGQAQAQNPDSRCRHREAVALSKSLTDLVCRQKNAVWIANEWRPIRWTACSTMPTPCACR